MLFPSSKIAYVRGCGLERAMTDYWLQNCYKSYLYNELIMYLNPSCICLILHYIPWQTY
jgi:hypothetical protein